MPISWNEIRDRSLAFSREWANESSEDAEAKSFWDGFFNVFGITRRRVASFEAPVKKGDGRGGYIDLLWKGVLLVEHKSRGKDLDMASRQAFDYFPGLKERDLPRYVLVSDFARFRLYDLEQTSPDLPLFQWGYNHTDRRDFTEFTLADLPANIHLFGFIAGYQTRNFGQQDPVNVQAAERLGKLHDQLKAVGYVGHNLEVLLVRLLFCLFAEDTALFEEQTGPAGKDREAGKGIAQGCGCGQHNQVGLVLLSQRNRNPRRDRIGWTHQVQPRQPRLPKGALDRCRLCGCLRC